MFSKPDVPKTPPVPTTPTKADASVINAGDRELERYGSLVSGAGQSQVGGQLQRKAKTQKPSLIG